jgi:photoactive yellow protein
MYDGAGMACEVCPNKYRKASVFPGTLADGAGGYVAAMSPGLSPPLLPVTVLPPEAVAAQEAADGMPPAALDAVPYGLIQLDLSGRILAYNATESRLASVPQAAALGKGFFTEVAPCCKVPAFFGRFTDGVIRESLDATFRFHFAFRQHPRDVLVRLWYARRSRSVWVLVVDEAPPPPG